MIVYRIVHKSLTDLRIGSGWETRWIGPGRKAICTSSSIALCCLEFSLRTGGTSHSSNFRTIFYEIPDAPVLEEVPMESLPPGWRKRTDYPGCQATVESWFRRADSLILRVPSAIIPEEYNFIIKIAAFFQERIQIVNQKIFIPDARME
jgi:RES domain-containing protein